jgi:hypothetical protein
MVTVPQEIVDTIIGFLVEDRASLLTCSLAGSSFYSPSRTHLFAAIEVNSLQRFRRLLELSTTSLATFDHESLKAFSSVHTISVRDVDAWITPEILPSLLFLPLLAPFPHVKDFRIDNLTLPGPIGEEALSVFPTSSLHVGRRVGFEAGWRVGTAHGDSTNEPLASSLESSATSLRALGLGNCQVPSLRWLLRYISYFPHLESLSLIDFTWQSVDEEGADQGPILQCRPTPRRSIRLSELTLEVQYTPPVASPPRLLFESLSGSLGVLRLTHIDMFLSVG